MLCIFQEWGNATSYTAGDSRFVTLKGPYRFGPSFFAGYGVFRFVPSIQTWSPSLYGLKFLFPSLPFLVTSCALTIACIALSRSLFSSEICASTDGVCPIFGFFSHSTLGVYPMIRSYGDLCVATFGHWLCVNSAIGSHVFQSSCCSSHQNPRYCSSH